MDLEWEGESDQALRFGGLEHHPSLEQPLKP
jgi:hypothetical protein